MGPLGNPTSTYRGIQTKKLPLPRKGTRRGTTITEIKQVPWCNNKQIQKKSKTGAGQDYLRTAKTSNKTGFVRS